MKILSAFILLFLAGHLMAAGSADYELTGTVTKKGGGKLEGVTVLLKGKNVSVVTGADGTFKFPPPVSVRMNAPETQTLSFTLRGNAVAFSLGAGKLNGNVTILAENGRRIASTDFSNFNPLSDRITLPQLASGLNIVRVTVDNTMYTCQILRLGNELHLMKKHAGASSDGGFTLGKRATSAAAVDTLVATKTGFKKAELPVESYTLSGLSIEMDSITGIPDEIAWGKVENPTAHCEVGTLPGYAECKVNSKLPDPFLKLDGNRIKSRSEWACRRQELHKSVLNYIYGDKPIPAKGSVSGSVSTTKISVIVNEGGKSCAFDLGVNMNGATQPAPAIIWYQGGMGSPLPIPNGVASIEFKAIEQSGGSGNKTGPFYTFYGAKHPAGYMAAQAWQISRVIDLLEQDPKVIDPYRIGLTGCSRNGKGAFVGGVLDNRIALTLPCESGIGGAVALRLVEQIGGSEAPYHAISYVRWLSEVALGPFTSGNEAAKDNTDRLPVDIHSAMTLIAPRGLYVIDNPDINNLDARESWVTTSAAKMVFTALGVGDNCAYVGAGGTHCQWRTQYNNELSAMIDKFFKGTASAKTGSMSSSGTKPDLKKYIDWEAPTLDGTM